MPKTLFFGIRTVIGPASIHLGAKLYVLGKGSTKVLLISSLQSILYFLQKIRPFFRVLMMISLHWQLIQLFEPKERNRYGNILNKQEINERNYLLKMAILSVLASRCCSGNRKGS